MDRRTIPVDKDTRDRLRGAKRDGETYDETVNRILDTIPAGDIPHEFTECPSCSGKLRYPTKADVECSDCGEVFYHEIRANGGHRLWGYNMAGELGEVADRAE